MKKRTKRLIENIQNTISEAYPFLDESEQKEIFENFIYNSLLNALNEEDVNMPGYGDRILQGARYGGRNYTLGHLRPVVDKLDATKVIPSSLQSQMNSGVPYLGVPRGGKFAHKKVSPGWGPNEKGYSIVNSPDIEDYSYNLSSPMSESLLKYRLKRIK